MIKYIQATCSGKGFITHDDKEVDGLVFRGFPGDIWVVDGNGTKGNSWKSRNSGVEKTQTEAQSIVNGATPEGKTPPTVQ